MITVAAAALLLASLTQTLAWVPPAPLSHNIIMNPSATASFKTTQLTAEQKDDDTTSDAKYSGYNVLGTELSCCCSNVGDSGIGTGFYR